MCIECLGWRDQALNNASKANLPYSQKGQSRDHAAQAVKERMLAGTRYNPVANLPQGGQSRDQAAEAVIGIRSPFAGSEDWVRRMEIPLRQICLTRKKGSSATMRRRRRKNGCLPAQNPTLWQSCHRVANPAIRWRRR